MRLMKDFIISGATPCSPCDMCTGAILLYKIPRVVIGENINFLGGEDLLRSRGVEVIVIDNEECKKVMAKFIQEHPEVCYFSDYQFQRLLTLRSLNRNGMRI